MFQGDYSNQTIYGQSNDWMLVRFIEEIYLEDYVSQKSVLFNDEQREVLYVLLEQIRENIFFHHMEWWFKGPWPSEKELNRLEKWMYEWGYGRHVTELMKTLKRKEDLTGHLSLYLMDRITLFRERTAPDMFINQKLREKLHAHREASGYYDQFKDRWLMEFDPII